MNSSNVFVEFLSIAPRYAMPRLIFSKKNVQYDFYLKDGRDINGIIKALWSAERGTTFNIGNGMNNNKSKCSDRTMATAFEFNTQSWQCCHFCIA